MAKTKSAKKTARRAVRRATTNQARLSRLRTFVKKVETAIAGGDRPRHRRRSKPCSRF